MNDLDPLLDQTIAEMREAGAAEDAPQMAAYMKDHFPFLGLRSPVRKQIQKPLVAAARKAQPDEVVAIAERCWELDEREFQYVGSDVLRAAGKNLQAEDLDALRHFVETKSWWDTVDALAAHPVGVVVRNYPELALEMDEWVNDADMWIARTAILHQLNYKADTDEERLFGYVIARAADTEFFIRKALGWALRNYSRIDPDAVGEFVGEHQEILSGLTQREATKHL